jgi:predicted nucleotidyltransferase component of viral defense system
VIPTAEVRAVAEEAGLFPTTIEKDYALGWVLFAISQHPSLSNWIFKGGTCLKKCFFDTYRFSEDLDFTLPDDSTAGAIHDGLREVGRWVFEATGIDVPEDGIEVEESVNKQGQVTHLAKLTFLGPLGLPRHSRQRIKFDLTHHELVVDAPVHRAVFHPYSDVPEPVPTVRCYSLEEVLAEKTRALVQRAGRARDLYDVVNIVRNFRASVDPVRTRDLASRKFAYKGLPAPTPALVLDAVKAEVVAVDWDQALRHQLPVLPSVSEFLAALREVLAWFLLPDHPFQVPPTVPVRVGEVLVPPLAFGGPRLGLGRRGEIWTRGAPTGAYGSNMDQIRYAARNRLLAQVSYHGVSRLVEPYSLRLPGTGNLLLYVYEIERGGRAGEGIKAFKVAELGNAVVTERSFFPRYLVEL